MPRAACKATSEKSGVSSSRHAQRQGRLERLRNKVSRYYKLDPHSRHWRKARGTGFREEPS
eukprot:2994572-Amphidinium_carterae.2